MRPVTRKFALNFKIVMSALGQKQTFAVQKNMSALLPKVDMCGALAHVCFVPKADMREMIKSRQMATEPGHPLTRHDALFAR